FSALELNRRPQRKIHDGFRREARVSPASYYDRDGARGGSRPGADGRAGTAAGQRADHGAGAGGSADPGQRTFAGRPALAGGGRGGDLVAALVEVEGIELYGQKTTARQPSTRLRGDDVSVAQRVSRDDHSSAERYRRLQRGGETIPGAVARRIE